MRYRRKYRRVYSYTRLPYWLRRPRAPKPLGKRSWDGMALGNTLGAGLLTPYLAPAVGAAAIQYAQRFVRPRLDLPQ